jgi:hypothetical protein
LREKVALTGGYTFRMNTAHRATATDRRLGLLLTILVHAALVTGWQAVRKLPALPIAEDSVQTRILWVPLRLPQPAAPKAETPAPPRKKTPDPAEKTRPRSQPGPAITLPSLPQAAPLPAPANEATPAPAEAPAAKPSAEQILQQAKRDIGSIAKALRKENNPYIAAPLDSPQIRMRRGMEQAAAMAAPRIWEAPKIEDLVNDTGDGARRSRVITGHGTYCITERSPATNVEMIEMHGKQRITNCPQHELPASKQQWRTLRD